VGGRWGEVGWWRQVGGDGWQKIKREEGKDKTREEKRINTSLISSKINK
jgi:hypothetical protein